MRPLASLLLVPRAGAADAPAPGVRAGGLRVVVAANSFALPALPSRSSLEDALNPPLPRTISGTGSSSLGEPGAGAIR